MSSPAPATIARTSSIASAETSPVHEYVRRLREREASVRTLEQSDQRISTARGLTFLAAMAILWLSLWQELLSINWIGAPLIVFLALMAVHTLVVDRLEQKRKTVDYYRVGLERLEFRWQERGVSGERYVSAAHPYSGDLDIFGRGSLFQLICRARTRLGEDTLAAWLSAPADVATIRQRQGGVEELRPALDLREEFATLDARVHDDINQNHLLHWSKEPAESVGVVRRVLAVLLAAAAIVSLGLWMAGLSGIRPFLLVLILQLPFAFSFRAQLRQTMSTIADVGAGLDILAEVLKLIERHEFHSPLLCELRSRLETEGRSPSRHIARLDGLIQNLNNSLQNQFFAPIAFVLGLPVHLVHAIEDWRTKYGSHIPEWLQAVGEFEALSSIAGYAYEHPLDPFPQLLEDGPQFEGTQVGHPLLPRGACVRNDLRIGGELRLMLVSGSNMSGKSTLMRTVGSNVVLALAGAPVCAQELRVSLFRTGTAMRISDSLQDGKSYFYAVISRLKSIVEMAGGEPPLLFLFDEILQGTNSHDRRVGAEGIIKRLVEQGAVGLVSTHDLALTEIAESLGPRGVNIHFEDRIVDGRMTFDYKIRPGVVQRSNALELMRMMGLGREAES